MIRVYIFISSTTMTLHRTRLGRTQSHSTSLTVWEPLHTTPSSFSRTSYGGSLSLVSTGILLTFHFFRCLCLCLFVVAHHLNLMICNCFYYDYSILLRQGVHKRQEQKGCKRFRNGLEQWGGGLVQSSSTTTVADDQHHQSLIIIDSRAIVALH